MDPQDILLVSRWFIFLLFFVFPVVGSTGFFCKSHKFQSKNLFAAYDDFFKIIKLCSSKAASCWTPPGVNFLGKNNNKFPQIRFRRDIAICFLPVKVKISSSQSRGVTLTSTHLLRCGWPLATRNATCDIEIAKIENVNYKQTKHKK